MSDPITLAQSRAPPSPAMASSPLPIAVASSSADGVAGSRDAARSSGSLQVRGRSPTPSRENNSVVCGSLRGASVRGSSPAVGGGSDDDDDAAAAAAAAAGVPHGAIGTKGNGKPPSVRGSSPPPPVAPYQALPVRGPVITHNMTAGLPVVEPGQTDPKELEARMTKVISDYTAQLTERTEHHMGYPYNLDFDSYKALEGLSRFCINNLGDPFIESNYGVHSRAFEIGVLEWFARLWEAPTEEEGGYWGYITNCGTEGNLHGILVGRENLPDAVLYASAETHYSVFKAARMYRMDAERVATLPSGEIDVDDFALALARNKGRPAVVVVNVGTTVRGAVDDLDAVLGALKSAGLSEDQFFIHCDGALFGLMMPFVSSAAPLVTFKKPIGSISVSGHKFIGAPMPCGVVMTRARCVEALSSDVEYLNSRDATIMGSRNGHAPIYMWYTLTRKGYEGMRRDVESCLANAHLLQDMLENAGVKTMLNRLSSTVVFERPPDEAFVRKWQLACEGDVAHVVVMPNITPPKLEAFVADLVECRKRFLLTKGANATTTTEAAANGASPSNGVNGAADAMKRVALGSNGTEVN